MFRFKIGGADRALALVALFSLFGAASADAANIPPGRPSVFSSATARVSGSPPPSSSSSAPSQAAAAGYKTETFSTVSGFSSKTVDMRLTNASGFQWYFFNFFGYQTTSAPISFNSDGSINIAEVAGAANSNIASAVYIPAAPYYRGTAFGGGGYFEATLSFNSSSVNLVGGWPAWWTMSIEHLAGLAGEQWPGQASGYDHFIEPDIFEADTQWAGANTYGGDAHDWYGQWGAATCSSYCDVSISNLSGNAFVRTVPTSTNFSQYHKYGLLWIPATSTRSGSLTYYFDGVQMGPTTSYSQYSSQSPVPTTSTPWTFGIVDKQHLVLILGTGASTPMRVQSVTVWQASAVNNMHN